MADGPVDRRAAGVLLHPTSLPTGTLGEAAHTFVDWLADVGFGVWQMLPLGPPGPTLSPYQTDSAHAGNPALVDPGYLVRHGWLGEDDRAEGWLERAADGFLQHADHEAHEAYRQFREASTAWLEDYARYRAIKLQQDHTAWWQWPEALRGRDPGALREIDARLHREIERICVVQWFFDLQWHALREHANGRNVKLFGDLPIFVAQDSADVWHHPELFAIDADGQPIEVAGVPPDYFSSTGQRWGNPLYDWPRHAEQGFAWWIRRLRTELGRFDWLRLDHFRGFVAYWAIPADAVDATRGQWREGPGRTLFDALRHSLGGLPLVAEDLGLITPDVTHLRDTLGLPGMAILQFAFDGGVDNPYLPFNHARRSVVYTGTHDNDTTLGWWNQLDATTREQVLELLGRPAEPMPWPMIRAALASVAGLAVVPLQDLLGLDGRYRMNTPGTTDGNWTWRFGRETLDGLDTARIRTLLRCYGRSAI